jgi:hypothetical protein
MSTREEVNASKKMQQTTDERFKKRKKDRHDKTTRAAETNPDFAPGEPCVLGKQPGLLFLAGD